MAKRNTYSPDFKVQVVEEYLSSKTSYRALTKKYNIPDTKSIREWIKKYNEFGKNYFYENHKVHPKKKQQVDFENMTLEEQNYYLLRELTILKKPKH